MVIDNLGVFNILIQSTLIGDIELMNFFTLVPHQLVRLSYRPAFEIEIACGLKGRIQED